MNMRTLKNLIAGLPDDTIVTVDLVDKQENLYGYTYNREDTQLVGSTETSVDDNGNYTLILHGKRD